MRVQGEHKRSGFFWLPSTPDKKVPGTVNIFDGGLVTLEIVGLLDESIEALNGKEDLSRIVGNIEKEGFITLERCFYKRKTISFGGISTSLIHANLALSCVGYEKDEKITFSTFSFHVEGLDEWLATTGLSFDYDRPSKSAAIYYTPPPEVSVKLENGLSLTIKFQHTLPRSNSITEAKITQRAFLELSSEAEIELDEFIETAHKLNYLLCFALDSTASINNVAATSRTLINQVSETSSIPVKVNIHYRSTPHSEAAPVIDPHKILFTFKNIEKDAEKVINNWLNAYKIIRPSMGLYFSAATGVHKYLDGKFLALAQALETFHRRTSSETLMENSKFRSLVARSILSAPKESRRWLWGRLINGNEISLSQRIKKIIMPFNKNIGNAKERGKLIRKIVDTRNYLTHYSESLEEKTTKGLDLWDTCQKMEAIFQLHLLSQLGLEKEQIQEILKINYKLHQKLRPS